MRTLIKNGHVVTVNPARDIFAGGFVVLSGLTIEAVGPREATPAGPFDRVIDANGQIVVPGLINLHQHPWMNLFKGLADGLLLEPWVFKFVQPCVHAMSRADLQASAALAALEMLRTGTTCFVNHDTRLTFDDYEPMLAELYANMGLRIVFAKLFQCRTPKLPDYPLSAEEARSATGGLIDRLQGAHGGMVRAGLVIECNAHHTELGKSSDELVCVGHALASDKDVPVAVHMSGGTLAMNMGFTRYLRLTGRRDVGYLHQLGVLDQRWLLKHGIHFSDLDIEMVRASGAHAVYTPTSESIRGGGLGPWANLKRAGVNCALGTDGPAVDYTVDMVEQMRACLYLQSVKYRDPSVLNAHQVLEMATINGARALGLADEIGSLEPGKRADLVLFDLNKPHLAVLHDPLAALVLAARGSDAHTVFVDGRMVLSAGEFVERGDVDQIIDEASHRGRALAQATGLAARATPQWPSLTRAQGQ